MKGVIAFLDILGYQSFLENNSATDSALRVLEMITTLPKSTHAELSKGWVEKNFDKTIVESLQHVIFSDTIVLLLPYGEEEGAKIRAAVAYMTTCAGFLAAKMFDAGLPLRGAIHEGEFIVKDSCFAGRGIVEAYRLCSRLDFAGLVITEPIAARVDADHNAERSFIRKDYHHNIFVSILSPLKGEKAEIAHETKLTHINWTMFTHATLRDNIHLDVIQFVMSRFWMHDKDCPSNVDGKIRNTCKILRRLRIAYTPIKPSATKPAELN